MLANPEASPTSSQERIFWPRTSEAVRQLAEVLASEPERPLSDEQKTEVIKFENELFHGKCGDIECASPLVGLPSTIDNTTQLVPEYFTTTNGRAELNQALGLSMPQTEDIQTISTYLRQIPFSKLQDPENKSKLQTLQGDSMNYLEARYVAMAEGSEPIRDIETVTVIKDPQLFVERLSVLQQNRAFLRQVRAELPKNGDDLTAAKRMVTDLYRDKLNSMIAGAYPTLMDLSLQYNANGESYNRPQTGDIDNLIRVATAAESSGDLRVQFLRLLDYVRNGAALDEHGNLTPIDEQIFADVAELKGGTKNSARQPLFSGSEIEQLKRCVFDSLEMQSFLDAYLMRTGLSREGWKTEIREDTKSFAVVALKKIVKIPQSYSSVVAKDFPSTGVVGLVEHEVGGKQAGHVMQSVNASKNPELFELAKSPKFGGKRYLSMREAGGTNAEADAMQKYFGQTRRFGTSYASALKVLLGGGAHVDAVKAFAEAQIGGRDVSPEESKKTLALAANRVMRLLREGGRNSQPVQYVEAASVRQVAKDMPESIVDAMFAEAVYDPVDMMRLHKFGLLATDNAHKFQSDEDPEKIIQELLREHISSES